MFVQADRSYPGESRRCKHVGHCRLKPKNWHKDSAKMCGPILRGNLGVS